MDGPLPDALVPNEVIPAGAGTVVNTRTIAFKGDITQRWGRHSIGFAGGGLRASSSPDARYAVRTPGDFEIVVPEAPEYVGALGAARIAAGSPPRKLRRALGMWPWKRWISAARFRSIAQR